MQKEVAERQVVYRDPEVANFLVDLLKSGGEIGAQSDVVHGYRYLKVETAMGKKTAEAKDFLKKLVSIGILLEKLSDMVICCPSCNSADLSTNYVCPSCGSPRILRNALIEHLVCGYIDNLTTFRVGNDLFCPKCKLQFGRNDYRSAGKWYECASCAKRIETPQVLHICRGCGEKFTFDDAQYVEVYKYTLSETAVGEIKGGALFSSLAESFFKDLKYEVKIPGYLNGASGVQYEFDVLLRSNDGEYIAVDHPFSMEPINRAEVMREYGKAFDAKVKLYIVASLLNEDAAKLAKNLGLTIIVGDLLESLSKVAETLESTSLSRKDINIRKELGVSLSKSHKKKTWLSRIKQAGAPLKKFFRGG